MKAEPFEQRPGGEQLQHREVCTLARQPVVLKFAGERLISQISQQGIKHPLAEAMDATVQWPQLRNLG